MSVRAVRVGPVAQIEGSESAAVEDAADLVEDIRATITGQYRNDTP